MNEAWWKKAVVYQIYPKSFNDTTGSGTGDLRGIIEKLDYLHTLGVDVIWLTPIYQSPGKDNGYDISDYFTIDPLYGTMADFEELLKQVHDRGMKLIMDLVINHTSTEHEWFKYAAQDKTNAYRHFYIWKDANNGAEPTNWQSKFGGSAWEYDEKTNQYYLHLFDKTQADLNWENEQLREKVYDMMRYWAEKGIDGFRLDVVNLISKHQDFPNDYAGDGRNYYTDGPRIHEFLHEMHQAIFKPYQMLTVGEMSSTSLENCILYTRPDREELTMTFQFHHLKVDYLNGEKWTKAPVDFLKLKRILSEWQVGMHEGNGWNALFWCNHDQPRVVSRFGDDGQFHVESSKMLATTLHMMQGTPYIYQGEEIGMTNPNFETIDAYRDVETLNAYRQLKDEGIPEATIMEILKQKSRDNGRTPMQWNAGRNAGFSSGETWIPLAKNYRSINVEKQISDKNSIFHHYKKLIALRKKYDILSFGDYRLLFPDHPTIFAYTRNWLDEQLIVISNFYGEELSIRLNVENARLILSNYPDVQVENGMMYLRPYESLVYYRS